LARTWFRKKIFFTKGVGKHRERLTSFELALRARRHRGEQNLVRVSSIFPPNCKLVPRLAGAHVSFSRRSCICGGRRKLHARAAPPASVLDWRGHPRRSQHLTGYLSEHHSFGETEDAAGDYAEELAAEMLATTLNVSSNSDRSWDEKKEIIRISNKIVRTANVTQSAVGDKRGPVDYGDRARPLLIFD